MSRLRKRILTVLIISNLSVLLISALYTAAFLLGEQSEGGSLFDCKFKELTYLYCPGCGGSRSLYYLLTLDLVKSFIFCPAVPVTALILLALDIRAVVAFIRDDISPIKSFNSKVFLIIPAVLLLNFLIRNILLLCGVDYIGDISVRFLNIL